MRHVLLFAALPSLLISLLAGAQDKGAIAREQRQEEASINHLKVEETVLGYSVRRLAAQSFSSDEKQISEIESGAGFTLYLNGKLVRNADNFNNTAASFSPDGTRIGFVQYEGFDGDRVFAVIDGVEDPKYKSIDTHFPIFSSDNKHYAYPAKTLDGGKNVVILDGKELPPCEKITLPPKFDADNHMYFAGLTNNRPKLYVDGNPLIGEAWGLSTTLDFTNYICLLKKPSGKFVIVHGNDESPEYDEIPEYEIAGDGKHKAYVGRLDKTCQLLLDGKKIDEHESFLKFRMSGDHIAYCATDSSKNKTAYYIDGKAVYDCPPNVKAVAISPDLKRMACVFEENGVQYVMTDGKPDRNFKFHKNSPLYFSPDGSHVLYTADTNNKKVVAVLDGQPGPEFREINSITFSPEGSRLAYVGVNENWTAVVDSKPVADFILPEADPNVMVVTVGFVVDFRFQFSPNGKHITYTNGKDFFLDNKPIPDPYGSIGTAVYFSSDSKHIYYLHDFEKENQVRLFIDGVPTPIYNVIFFRAAAFKNALPDGSCDLFADRDQKLLRIRVHAPEKPLINLE